MKCGYYPKLALWRGKTLLRKEDMFLVDTERVLRDVETGDRSGMEETYPDEIRMPGVR